jgi:hypothetical protein
MFLFPIVGERDGRSVGIVRSRTQTMEFVFLEKERENKQNVLKFFTLIFLINATIFLKESNTLYRILAVPGHALLWPFPVTD